MSNFAAGLILSLSLMLSPALMAQEQAAPPNAEHSASQANEAAAGAKNTGEHAATPEGQSKEAVEHGEGAQEKEMPNEMAWKWANFAILAVVLGWLVSKNAGPYFAARGKAIEQGIADARAMKEDADRRAAAIEARLSNLSGEIENLRSTAKQEIGAEAERIKAETGEQLKKVQAHAQSEIAAAAKTASAQLKAEAAELAVKLAEEQLKGRLSATEQDGLMRSFVNDLGAKAGKERLN